MRSACDLVYAVLAGVPPDVVTARPGEGDYAAILGDARMTPDFTGEQLLPACTSADLESVRAAPPSRLVRLGQALSRRGAATVLGSVCEEDLGAPVGAIVAASFEARDRRCGLTP